MVFTPSHYIMTAYAGSWRILVIVCQVAAIMTEGRRHRDELIVNTEKGLVRGIRYHLPNLGKAVDAYLGIPFAKPPLDHLRFKHPQPIDRWDGIYNATKLPNSCYQVPDEFFGSFKGSTMWNPNTRVSEDCLYLNVWVPKIHPRVRKSAVMLWIYGGGFYSGTTTLNVYDGKILAALNDIIVVSIGYRVGALGFLFLGHPAAPGNAGMFDQLMGLEWVQQNIRHFGGDPNNVTLFGESAGSVSVSLHLLSPLSRSKFQRAIMESGTANMPWGTMTPYEGKRRSLQLALEYLKCDQTPDMQEIVNCLRRIPPQKLVEEQWVSRGIMQFPFIPVIDGAFLPEHPVKILKQNNFKKCPILLGSNQNEGSFFLIYELHEYLQLQKQTMTEEEFNRSINLLFYHYPQYPQENNKFGLNAILYMYTNHLDPDDKDANILNLDASTGDCHFICHLNYFQQYYARAGENVYAYYFTQRYISNPWPEWMGVLHGDEIFFVFGEPFKPGANFTKDEQELAMQMMRYWTNFAKTGDPNRAPGRRSLNEWPLYTPKGKEYLELNAKFLHEPDKSLAVDKGLRAKPCAFWKEYLPGLVRNSEVILKVNPPVHNVSCLQNISSTSSTVSATWWLLLLLLLTAVCRSP